MIGRILYGACAVALVATTAVMAQPSGTAASSSNKQICRTFPNTGSRLSRTRECHTAAEWIEIRRQLKQTIDRAQSERPLNGKEG
jgi:hypothetical protein